MPDRLIGPRTALMPSNPGTGPYNPKSTSVHTIEQKTCQLTLCPDITDSPHPRLQGIDPTITCRDPQAPTYIASQPKRRPVHSEDRTFAAGGPTARVRVAVGVGRAPPQGVVAFEGEHGLGDVSLDEGDCTGVY